MKIKRGEIMTKKSKVYLSLSLSLVLIFSTLVQTVHAEELYVNAISAIALDCDSKVVLYEKNAYTPIEIASTTKIITALVAIKCGDLNKKIIVSKKAATIRGSEIGLKEGEELTLKELLYGLLMRSGNDAAIAIAEGVSGSVDEFLKLMNEYALEIGLLNSNFESPHGLDSSNHYSTAYDLALITAKAKEVKIFNDIVGSKDIIAKDYDFTRSYHNINKILSILPNSTGVKTGFTGKAGKCLVTSVKIQNRDIIIITLNCTPRWKETEKINNYIEKTYKYKKVVSKGDILGKIILKNGNSNVEIVSKKDIIIPVKNNQKIEIKVKKPLYEVYAPVHQGEKIGRLDVYANNKLLLSESLVSKSNAYSKTNFRFRFNKIKNFILQ
ncbi:D-alanyl-D-alanine carboxypeptidase [Clostridium estertheticum]|uniref:D-alanyl-D-alanine carboxypeptidase family protein n=1 Tax=Clostridium estertheticum TaxID=238834 RepID=UPI001CF43267|nr:D-alanyl-D-alanine carboxypeptidase family protein [Clostridium estertheticum]MCB2308018.1 D-alanyl-D-alanine carboxypeptidase [Clostridium estertheticum]MCB2346142.1 D-alanyl-D-alanine carboxypeptidase [Clostridium estertheticum]MCB2351440.1 D-alanyl-D-alanine carboxypeptidase [Clostridium estertheticum]WAG44606.1 D-alanyl-D-alanine carboxypeptidase [Clostridium estertheticum]